MPRRPLRKLHPERIEELKTKYPLWLVDLGVQFNAAERLRRQADTSRGKLKLENPEEYERRTKEYWHRRKLRECGVIPPFVPKGSYHAQT